MKKSLCLMLSVSALSIATAVGIGQVKATSTAPSANNLRVNLLSEAYGINQKAKPTFSWAMTDQAKNSSQKAYQIQINKGTATKHKVINTGWVYTSDSSNINVKGIDKLANNQLYYWRVKVKDNHGKTSSYSKAQPFTTKTSWQSTNMIWAKSKSTGKLANFAFVKKAINIKNPKKIQKAMLSVTGRENEKTRQFIYSFFVNNHFVGEGPARSNKGEYYYNNFDITKNLKKGKNVLGAINYSTENQGLLAQLTVYYKDGTKKVLTNSGTKNSGWQVMDGTKAFSEDGTSTIGSLYFFASPQNINENDYPSNFTDPKVTTKGWTKPVRRSPFLQSSDETLVSYSSENVQRYAVKPASVTNKGNGTYLIDLGKEIVGSFGLKNIKVNGNKAITLKYGEELENGTVKEPMRTTNNYVEHWTLKKGTQSPFNTDLMTYRYVEVSNSPVKLTTNNVQGFALHQPFNDQASSFKSSNSLLNNIYDFTKYSIKATNQDLMVDSQSRERGVYEGDTLINSLSSDSFSNDYSLSRFSTDWGLNNPTWPAEYGLYQVMNVWNDYQYTGDKSLLTKVYSQLKASRNDLFVHDIDANGLVRNDNTASSTMNAVLVDWPQTERDDYVFGSYDTVLNAIAYGAYTDMAKIAGATGNSADQAQFEKYASNLKQGMIKYLYNAKNGEFRDSENTDHASEHSQAYALTYGIYDSPEMANKLTAALDKRGNDFHTSIFGAYFVLNGLYNGNDGKQAMNLLNSTGIRSWSNVMNNLHATITPEAWDPSLKPNMTFSHPWGSAPAIQIVQGMFGIKPTAPGFKSFQVKLQPGDVQSASVTVPTMKGTIKVSYNQSGDKMSAKITVPANTTATVYLPTAANSATYQKTELGSGTYSLNN